MNRLDFLRWGELVDLSNDKSSDQVVSKHRKFLRKFEVNIETHDLQPGEARHETKID